jgi:hypothetical protein
MQEAPRLAGGPSPRLVARDHIVRRRDHVGRAAWRRAQPAERAKQGRAGAQAKITTLNAVLQFQGSIRDMREHAPAAPTRTAINNPSIRRQNRREGVGAGATSRGNNYADVVTKRRTYSFNARALKHAASGV